MYDDRTEWRNLSGALHREDGPAIEYTSGCKKYFLNGELHREDGPAIEWPDGIIQKSFNLENENGVCYSGRSWWKHGKMHRIGGPALIIDNGLSEWWVDGVQYSEIEYESKFGGSPELGAAIDKLMEFKKDFVDTKIAQLPD